MAAKQAYKERKYGQAKPGYEPLGPLRWLPGTWESKGRGWNMIALPSAPPPVNFRVLMNQYNETLRFSFVDDDVPNRGINIPDDEDTDQLLVALDYQQSIDQVVADDFPDSGKEGPRGADIHHEPGLWLHMKNLTTDKLDIARLATIPHGNSVLALGRAEYKKGNPEIPVADGLPIGVPRDLDGFYMSAYKHFEDNPFFGDVPNAGGFPGFFPTDMNAILRFALDNLPPAVNTTILHVDTKLQQAGVVNIPFVEKQADASEMTSTFWIQELEEKDDKGNPKLRLQYTQTVMLDFFPRPDGSTNPDGSPQLIRWPHISINTLDKVSDEVLPVA